ncbi:MAG: metallophosphoesterase, partial [Betaproteobacteria bacterium]|nr:metallophosphoesterase [Betaproteobacteria bacterium]
MNKRHCQLLLALLLTACSAVEPPAPAGDAAERGAAGGVVRVVAAGDIADCGTAPAASSMASQTAGLVSAADAAVLTLGDHVYPDGAPDEFARCFDPTWGRFRQRQRPSPGNHDYRTPGAAGYYAYFGDLAGPDRRGYYSFDLGHWHFISLNSAVDAGPGSAQLRWLVEDLKASAGARCTLAYWHHPVFSSGPHGNDARMKDVYAALYAAGADIVLS